MIPCKKCLLAELASTDYTKSLMEHIASVPPDRRVDEQTYQARLAVCKDCDDLQNGMCAQCGCYVELRALKPDQSCPHPTHKWTSVQK